MSAGIATKAFAIWVGMFLLAFGNGLLRETILVPVLGKMPGLFLSGVLLSALILAVAYFSLPWFGPVPVPGYITIGMSWLCLTLAFELASGRFIQSKPWSELLEAYTFKGGNIWPLVLFVVATSPCIAARIRGWV